MATYQIYLGGYDVHSNTYIDSLDIVRNRRITRAPIIRSNLTIIPEGKLQPLKITVGGVLVSTDYTTLRDALVNLEAAVYNGKQRFTLDDERYAVVINSNFSRSFIGLTNFITKYKAKFEAELPFWLDLHPNSDSRTPSSGDAYTVNNGGQVPIPAKVLITAGDNIVDDIMFQNDTSSLEFKYRGTLASGDQLTVDMGFDYDNKPTYTVSSLASGDVISHFEGDFLELATGDNSLIYSGASATIAVHWRKGFYD